MGDEGRAAAGLRFRAHPWHGVPIGDDAPERVTTYIEIVPTDTVKYEIDKPSGILKVDRPQKYSSLCPTLYGFIPRTFCGERVGRFCSEQVGRPGIGGDGDPLDICVLTEKPISHGDILVRAVPIGGLRMIDADQADDKIIAVMQGDAVYGGWTDVAQVPPDVVERLRHYFLTYKDAPDGARQQVEIAGLYDHDVALEVIRLSQADYGERFGG